MIFLVPLFFEALGFQAPATPTATTQLRSSALIADDTALLAQSQFPIKAAPLIDLAKEVLSKGIGTKDNGDCLAEDFEFVAAVVGPLGKEEYLNALENFKLEEAFDIQTEFHLFRVDPYQPNRVYFHTRSRAVHTGELLGKKPTGKKLELPPQCFHFDFHENGKLKELGFYVIDRRQGNTGGLGGAFGFLYGVGQPLPIPECQPYKPSMRFRMLQLVGRLGRRLKKLKGK